MIPSIKSSFIKRDHKNLSSQHCGKKEKGELIATFELIKGLENVDREDLLARNHRTRGHELRKTRYLAHPVPAMYPSRQIFL